MDGICSYVKYKQERIDIFFIFQVEVGASRRETSGFRVFEHLMRDRDVTRRDVVCDRKVKRCLKRALRQAHKLEGYSFLGSLRSSCGGFCSSETIGIPLTLTTAE
jgi:hypothetical protein